jgi:hypothetical protein
MWLDPVFDRTQEDVDFANKNRNHPEPLKGMRNVSDLNRISGNMKYLCNLLLVNGYNAPEITSRDDWEKTDFPRESDVRKYQADLTALREVPFLREDTPQAPELPYLHYQKLNDIEQILFDIHQLLQNTMRNTNLGWTMGIAHLGLYAG